MDRTIEELRRAVAVYTAIREFRSWLPARKELESTTPRDREEHVHCEWLDEIADEHGIRGEELLDDENAFRDALVPILNLIAWPDEDQRQLADELRSAPQLFPEWLEITAVKNWINHLNAICHAADFGTFCSIALVHHGHGLSGFTISGTLPPPACFFEVVLCDEFVRLPRPDDDVAHPSWGGSVSLIWAAMRAHSSTWISHLRSMIDSRLKRWGWTPVQIERFHHHRYTYFLKDPITPTAAASTGSGTYARNRHTVLAILVGASKPLINSEIAARSREVGGKGTEIGEHTVKNVVRKMLEEGLIERASPKSGAVITEKGRRALTAGRR